MIAILFWLAGSMVADAAYPLAPQSNRQSDGETQQVGVEADEIQSAVELGRRVAARYRALPYLALSGMVEETQNNHVLAQVYFEAEMADGRHLLNATLAAGVLTISFSDGCVREEFRPAPGAPADAVIEYDAPRAYGTPSIQLRERLGPREGCMIGGMLGTWLGAKARAPVILEKWFAEGKLLPGGVLIDGRPCYIVEWSGSVERTDTLFVEKDSLLLCEWRTAYVDGILRVEHYWLDPRAEVPERAFGGSASTPDTSTREKGGALKTANNRL